MRAATVVLLASASVVSLGACHLADTPDAPNCGAGSHVVNGHCEADFEAVPAITIASCAPTPASLKTIPNGSFRFQNNDAVDHTIAGADGQTWTTAAAGQSSMLVGITKVGSWPYTISGCSAPGVVVVE